MELDSDFKIQFGWVYAFINNKERKFFSVFYDKDVYSNEEAIGAVVKHILYKHNPSILGQALKELDNQDNNVKLNFNEFMYRIFKKWCDMICYDEFYKMWYMTSLDTEWKKELDSILKIGGERKLKYEI